MENLKVRLLAIAMVISFRIVLTDEKFVASMNKATSLYHSKEESSNGTGTLEEILFGEGHESLSEKLAAIKLADNILMDITVHPIMKITLVERLREGKSSAEEIDKAFQDAKHEMKR